MEESESKDMLRKMLKRSFGAIKPINDHRYAPDEEICRIIEKMMKIDLKARYQNMDDVVTDLGHFEATMKPTAPAAADPAPRSGLETEQDKFEAIFTPAKAPEPAGAETTADDTPEGPGTGEPLQSFEVKAVVPKSVLCVESQDEIQDALRKSLTNWGYRALLVSDAERAAERYREAPVDAVIFDTDGQGNESIEAFLDMHEKAHEEGHQLLALVLLGPKQGALREKLPSDDRLIILSKPIKMKQVQDALAQLLPRGH
jgi:eukaryotic-like serine/threonine-protein kinase